jgi:spore coat polysaccharide biosynthesis protein SpsF
MILAILQARVSSTRLPGKVLLPLLGRPMLSRQIERLLQSNSIDRLVVATSDEPADEVLERLCAEMGVACYRGSINDVLDRFYRAALPLNPEHVVRITGDCPLIDPDLIDQMVAFYLEAQYDYVSNCVQPTLPDGLDAEVFRFTSLCRAWREARLLSEREHVTPFIYGRPELFRQGLWRNALDLSNYRWTVDEPADFELITKIYQALYPKNPRFRTDDVLALLQKEPQLQTINARYMRNEGYQKSLEIDKKCFKQQE